MAISFSHALYTCALGAAIAAACSSGGTGAGATQEALTNGPAADAATSTDAGGDAGDAGTTTDPLLAICSDGQSAAIMHASSQTEIDLANAVMPALSSMAAKSFAQQMITDHTTLDQALTAALAAAGISMQDNGLSQQIQAEGAKTVTDMATLTGSELDLAYIRHGVLEHLGDLAMTDHVLTPSIQNAQLAAVGKQSRDVIAAHLQLATQADATLEGACGGSTNDGGTSGDGGESGSDGGTSDSGTNDGGASGGGNGTTI
jgi:putative membrane protein